MTAVSIAAATGAVGGIVGEGRLPAYTRITLKFSGLAILLGVGRSTTSRVIQTFKTEGVVEIRRGAILLRRWNGCGGEPVFVTNPSKTTSGKCCAGFIGRKQPQRPRPARPRPGSGNEIIDDALFSGDF